jgi:hypothetical protein
MNECEWLETCQVWTELQAEIKYIWIKHYCTGDKQDRCERKRAYRLTGHAPRHMLPNGSLLKHTA